MEDMNSTWKDSSTNSRVSTAGERFSDICDKIFQNGLICQYHTFVSKGKEAEDLDQRWGAEAQSVIRMESREKRTQRAMQPVRERAIVCGFRGVKIRIQSPAPGEVDFPT